MEGVGPESARHFRPERHVWRKQRCLGRRTVALTAATLMPLLPHLTGLVLPSFIST